MIKSQQIPLLNFESYVDPNLLLDAEKLFDEGNLKELKQTGRGKWSAKVQNTNGTYELTATIHEGKIHQASCSCQDYPKRKSCAHEICLFFGLRHSHEELKQKKERKRLPKRKTSDYLHALLGSVAPNELQSFIHTYAHRDKTFKLLLATHFSRHIHDQTGPELYEQILDECFPIKTENSKKSYVSETRLLIKVGREMLVNYRDALSLEAYTEAFHLIQSLNHKVAYALFIYPKENKALNILQSEVHAAYKLLLTDRMAPALKHEIVFSMIETIDKSFYRYRGTDSLYELVLISHPTMEQFTHFRNILGKKAGMGKDLNEQAFYLAYFIHAVFQFDEKSIREELTEWFESDQVLMIETIRKMLELGFVRDAEKTLDFYYEKDRIDELSYYQFQLRFLESAGRRAEASKVAFKLFTLSLNPKFVGRIKSLSGSKWPEQYLEIIHFLEGSKLEKNYDLAMKIAEQEEDNDTLYELLNSRNELKFFLEYDKKLAGTHPEALLRFYRDYILNYLSEHAGEKAARKVIGITQHLAAIGLGKIAQQIQQDIIQHFPERKTVSAFIRSSGIR